MKPKLKYIGLSLLVGTAALVCAVGPAQAADKKPNILVIWGMTSVSTTSAPITSASWAITHQT
jgi:hypothetical protein